MSRKQTNSWGDPIHFPRASTTRQERSEPSPHAEMSWTVCYDDDCEIHLREKQGSGWFPKRRNRKGPRYGNGKGKGKGARRDLDEDDPENRPWGDGGDGGGCPIPTEEEVKVILARKAAREAAQAKAAAAAASGAKKGAQIGRGEEEAKPKARISGGVGSKAAPEVKSEWAEKIRELLAGGVRADGCARLNASKYANNSSGRFPAEAVVKPVSSSGYPTPAAAKHEPCAGGGRFAPPSRTTIAPANLNPSFERKQFTPPVTTACAPARFDSVSEKKLPTSPPITTTKAPRKAYFTSPHTTTASAEHSPAIDKKRFVSPPVAATHASAILDPPHLEGKQQFASSPTTDPHQKLPLQPRKDQDKTNPYPKPSKMSHQDSPVAASIPTAVMAARVAAKAKLTTGWEEKFPQMIRYNQVVGAKAGVV